MVIIRNKKMVKVSESGNSRVFPASVTDDEARKHFKAGTEPKAAKDSSKK